MIAKIKKFNNSGKSIDVFHVLDIPFYIANRINNTIKIRIAEYSPNLPISYAIFYNFICRGVAPIYYWSKAARILPLQLIYPTTITIILPSPVNTFVPLIIIGDGISSFVD